MGSLDVQPWQSSRLFRKLATCADARLSRLRPHLPSIGLLGPALHGRLEATWWRPPRCLYKSWRLLGANAATWRATWIHHMRLHSSSFDRYIYIYIYICVCSFLRGFVGCRESYTITWPPYFLKNIMDVFFVSLRGVSLNPMRYHVEDQKIWLVDESSGWWEEKKPCGVNLKEAFDLLHDVNLKDIMQQWVEPSAPSLQWQ